MADERTRIRIDNSKHAADRGRSISIAELSALIDAADPTAELTRLVVDPSKGSADDGKSCTLAEIAAVIAGANRRLCAFTLIGTLTDASTSPSD